MLDDLLKSLLLDPVSSLGLISFYIIFLSTLISIISAVNKKTYSAIRYLTVTANLFLASQLLIRWVISSHFPISNLYESLCFLSWALILFQLLLEREYRTPLIPAIANFLTLITLGFASFVLPDDLRLSSSLVPALKSSWLFMHVTVVMLSYAALIIGSCLSTSVLLIDKNQVLQIRSNSIGIGGFKFNSVSKEEFIKPIKFSHLEKIDTLSYRSILIGFVLLTLGLATGAVWANEAWGTWWSWDPKETWALITWLFYASYLHMRISKGWQGRKPAILATGGFFIVLVCYLGVNFWGVGLHSYGWIFG